MTDKPQRFGFVQLDFAGSLGLADGRYLARQPDDGQRVLVIRNLGAPPRRQRRLGRRAGTSAALPPGLPLTRVTAIRADIPFDSSEDSAAWAAAVTGDRERMREEVDQAVRLLNRALHALAMAEADPYIGERRAEQAVTIRIGHGSGAEVAEGNFDTATEATIESRRRRRRDDGISSQERMAAILGERESHDLCEVFLLRARADLNGARQRETALGLAVAIGALLEELGSALADPGHQADIATIRAARAEAAELADQALNGVLPEAASARLEELLTLCERVLRRRRLLRG